MVTKIGLYPDKRNKKKTWVVRWFGEYDPATGKSKRSAKSFRLKVDAEAFQAQQAQAFRKGQRRDKPEDVSLQAFCKDWLKIRKPELRPGTVTLYKNAIEQLLSYFGPNCLLSHVTARSAAKFIAELKRLDGKDAPLSNWSRNRILRNSKTMFETAVTWELIAKNPFKAVTAPKCIAPQWHYVKPNEYKKLLDVAPTLRRKAFYALAYGCGLRLGELTSLTWSDIDFGTREVRVQNHRATETLPPFFVKDTEARTIPIPKHCLDMLEDLKAYNDVTDQTPYVLFDERQYKAMLAKWKRHQQQKRPWRNQDTAPNALRKFKQHVREASIKPNGSLTIHTLRKSCIQNWATEITNPEVVRVLAGHSDLKTTMQYYCQADREQKARAAAAIDDLLEKSDVKVTYGTDSNE